MDENTVLRDSKQRSTRRVFSTAIIILVGMLAVRSTSHPDGFVARHGIME